MWKPESFADYLKAPGLQSSGLRELATRTPAHFKHRLENPKAPTPAMEWGTTVHRYILEGAPLAVAPQVDRRTKAGKEAMAAFEDGINPDALIVTLDQAEALQAMRANVRSLEGVAAAIDCGEIEVSGYATLNDQALKIRPDCRCGGVILDLKTTQSAAPEAFARDAANLGYALQASMYLTVASIIDNKPADRFVWIAVEKDPPYLAAAYVAGPEFLALGSELLMKALGRYQLCSKTVQWPGYDPGEVTLTPPAWILKNLEAL